jgi:hypothetical protein
MPRPRRSSYVITDIKAVRLLAAPVRQAILDLIVATGPMTVAALSAALDRRADRLYYHVKLLVSAGLLVPRAPGAGPGRQESSFDVPGRPMVLQYQPSSRPHRRAVTRVVGSLLRSASRDFSEALAAPGVRTSGARREVWSGRVEALLPAKDIETLNRLLGRLHSFMQEHRPPRKGAKRVQFTWAMTAKGH